MAEAEPRVAFLRAATWHGDLGEAEALLAAHPELRSGDIHTAAVLGDDAAVRRFITQDRANVTATSPPYGGDALNYLCLSKYLRMDAARSDAFLRAATALLDAGADPNTGFWTPPPHPERETALYGAAGVAHHEAMTRLLLSRGADPNDDEACYHSPETYDNAAMRSLVETGRVTAENLAMMLIRKHDWHDYEGAQWLLEHGADPNLEWRRQVRPLLHAVRRDNALPLVELDLDHGGDPAAADARGGRPAIALAARRGRGDLLALFERRGFDVALAGVDGLIAACARDDAAAVRRIAAQDSALVREVVAAGGTLLAEFAGNGNAAGCGRLLDLGVSVSAPFTDGDGYWEVPPGSLAIHVAAWRACHPVVRLLIERGSPVDVPDARGRTPLALAVKACVDSYWSNRRSPESVRLLLEAGASIDGARYPSGYDEVDALLAQAGARGATST